MWFAGNHSDIGGSYPEEESRLSDIALEWMVNEATRTEFPLIVDRSKLNLFPDPMGMQHCEVESVLDGYPGWWPKSPRWSWKKKFRNFEAGYRQHPSVEARMKSESVSKLGRSIKYDPLREREAGQQ
jgi:hypothetical protein